MLAIISALVITFLLWLLVRKISNVDSPKQSILFTGPQNEHQKAVVRAAQHAWNGYKAHAWGHDNLKPISKTFDDSLHLGLTIVDSLDTLYIMGMEKEFKEARDWIESSLKLDTDRNVNLFEVTIRVLGGLLSAYHLSDDELFLTKAVKV